ncbi:flavin-containing monooxygenase [Paracoccus sp. p3-h83]|uniref:flavin-containing monooxygenase n=1 Tax=Paracoccus sp. p3-h83 TaxID=3342805 RepID=UPI0035B6F97B
MQTIIIGASAAGLAAAKCLSDQGIKADLLEASNTIGLRWQNHYRRLHLHTPKSRSALPGLAFPRSAPRYPSRQDVVDYIQEYARHFNLRPTFNTPVNRVAPTMDGWQLDTPEGARHARHVILATGYNNLPHLPDKPGLSSFPGRVLHAADYRSGAAFSGQKVLVVGFGNSGCEIAIDLHEQGARPSISVRGPVNVVPRDLFGIPILALGEVLRHVPRLADRLNAPLMRLILGDIRSLGLQPLAYGPMQQIARGQIPLLDIGTLRLMREGAITRQAGIARIEGPRVIFDDGRSDDFDAIVFATGYRHGLEQLLALPDDEKERRINELRMPIGQRQIDGTAGLHIIGGYLSPRGMLYEIGHEARHIARRIADSMKT